MSAGNLRKYETVIVTRTDAGQEAQKRLYEKFQELLEKHGGHHVRFELWGKRRLAYPIGKAVKGIYLYHVTLAGEGFVRDLNRMLKLNNVVLRYMTIVLASGVDAATYDFEKERQFDNLPSDADEASERSRATTGWDGSEFQTSGAEDEDDEDEDEDEGDESRGKKGEGEDDEEEE